MICMSLFCLVLILSNQIREPDFYHLARKFLGEYHGPDNPILGFLRGHGIRGHPGGGYSTFALARAGNSPKNPRFGRGNQLEMGNKLPSVFWP